MSIRRTYFPILSMVSVLILGFAGEAFSQGVARPRTLVDGVRFDTIEIGKSTFDDVIKRFGDGYNLINLKDYSLILSYKSLGLDFYACYQDTNREVFVVSTRKPASVRTSKGILLGKSNLGDVLALYGGYGDQAYSDSDQKGVQFFVQLDDDSDIAYKPPTFEVGTKNELKRRKMVINQIDLVEPEGLRQCDAKFPKVQ